MRRNDYRNELFKINDDHAKRLVKSKCNEHFVLIRALYILPSFKISPFSQLVKQTFSFQLLAVHNLVAAIFKDVSVACSSA